jgi:choice-of-anchor A domain-containing protein
MSADMVLKAMSTVSTRRLRARLRPLASVLLFTAASAAVAFAGSTTTPVTDVDDVATDFENFNLISFGNASFSNYGDTQGALAVNGNLTLSGSGSIGNNPIVNSAWTNNPSLYVTGQLSLSSGSTTSLNSGYAALPGLTASNWTWNATNKSITSTAYNGGVLSSINAGTAKSGTNPIDNPAPAGWNWSTLHTNLNTISTDLANTAATGSISVNSGQQLQFIAAAGQTSGVAVFDLNAKLLSGNTYNGQTFSDIQINVPAGLTYVINVVNAAGTTIFGSGANFNSGTNDNQLLWNITGNGTVSISNGGYFYGSILAPNTTIDTTTTIDGQVAAASFSDSNVELHDDEFSPAAVATPEPATYALWAVGICALGIAWRRFQKPRAQAAS